MELHTLDIIKRVFYRHDFVTTVGRLCRQHSVFLKDRGRRLMVADSFRFPGMGWAQLRRAARFSQRR